MNVKSRVSRLSMYECPQSTASQQFLVNDTSPQIEIEKILSSHALPNSSIPFTHQGEMQLPSSLRHQINTEIVTERMDRKRTGVIGPKRFINRLRKENGTCGMHPRVSNMKMTYSHQRSLEATNNKMHTSSSTIY